MLTHSSISYKSLMSTLRWHKTTVRWHKLPGQYYNKPFVWLWITSADSNTLHKQLDYDSMYLTQSMLTKHFPLDKVYQVIYWGIFSKPKVHFAYNQNNEVQEIEKNICL